ncbi:MAG: amidohydrolase family protein [Hymenobacter sp.]
MAVARASNDALAEIVRANPTRFQALAAVPTPQPDAAAEELERAVTQLGFCGAMLFGRTGEVPADARAFDPLYATAARLGAPLYLHPQTPVPAVMQAYYAGFDQSVSQMFGTFGVGWYYDNGVQLLRLIFSGVFDRHPGLQVIVGHWGELVLFYLDHIASMQATGLHLERPLADYFRQNVWVTGSGVLSERYLRWTAEVVGTDRLMYSTDYPFTYAAPYPPMDTSRGRGRRFLEAAPFTEAEKVAIGSGNWERLCAGIRR